MKTHRQQLTSLIVVIMGGIALLLAPAPVAAGSEEDGDAFGCAWCATSCPPSATSFCSNRSCSPNNAKCTDVICTGVSGKKYFHRINCAN